MSPDRVMTANELDEEKDARCSLPDLEKRQRHNKAKDEVEVLLDGPLEATDNRLIEWTRNGGGGRLFPPSTKPYNITIDNTGNWKQSEVYQFYVGMIDKYFGKKSHGFFVEAGALDGVLLSTTLKLEMDFKWSGLLVEPRPDMFEQLLQKQRKAHAANFCLSEKTYPHKVRMILTRSQNSLRVVYN
ncbi:hypothetical protein SK128_011888 [Halocaridina rubra]|uniref:Uncharacterized protein n=1 Tax=Halocaridina rubra TaxID=373956 RepID=A0AAN9A6X6_HALRR